MAVKTLFQRKIMKRVRTLASRSRPGGRLSEFVFLFGDMFPLCVVTWSYMCDSRTHDALYLGWEDGTAALHVVQFWTTEPRLGRVRDITRMVPEAEREEEDYFFVQIDLEASAAGNPDMVLFSFSFERLGMAVRPTYDEEPKGSSVCVVAHDWREQLGPHVYL